MRQWLKRYGWRIPASVLYGLLFFELFVRLMGSRWFFREDLELLNMPYQFSVQQPEADDLADPRGHRMLEEGRPGKIVTITGDGLRAPEHGDERVGFLALGSSSTFAGNQDDRMAWPALTAEFINRRLGRPAVWIGNAAHDGMNTAHNQLHMRYLAPRYGVQGVILNIGLNDANYFFNNDVLPALKPDTELRTYIEAFPLPSVEHMLQLESSDPWWHRSHLYQFGLAFNLQIVEQKIGTKIKELRGQDLQSRRRQKSQSTDLAAQAARCQRDYAEILRQLLAEARRTCNGLEVVVMPMPPIEDKSDDILVAVNRAVRQVCREEKTLLFDIEERLKNLSYRMPENLRDEQKREYLAKKRYLYHDGHHFNNEASIWLAGELADFMIRNCVSIRQSLSPTVAAIGNPAREE